MELCLGTVQFGMDYGIHKKKKPAFDECVRCLEYAADNGITSFDTASAYGNAEEILGFFLKKHKNDREKFWISSKLYPCILDKCPPNDYKDIIRREIKKSLTNLGIEYLDAYYFHTARYAFENEMIDALHEISQEGLAKKIGISVYETNEAEACLNSSCVSIMQVPYSVFDHRMKNAFIFKKSQEHNVEVDARSTFLQGLVLTDADSIPEYLSDAKKLISVFKEISNECGIDRVTLALAYVKEEKEISRLVFGVRSIDQLQQDIIAFQKDVSNEILINMQKKFENVKKEIVIPSLWKNDHSL